MVSRQYARRIIFRASYKLCSLDPEDGIHLAISHVWWMRRSDPGPLLTLRIPTFGVISRWSHGPANVPLSPCESTPKRSPLYDALDGSLLPAVNLVTRSLFPTATLSVHASSLEIWLLSRHFPSLQDRAQCEQIVRLTGANFLFFLILGRIYII
jgi:hypothetical protein